MNLQQMRAALAPSLDRHAKAFAAGQALEPELAQHASPSAALAPWLAANLATETFTEEHERLVLALLRCSQHTKHRLWADCLLVTLSPMLGGIARRLRVQRALRDDRDSIVVEAFYAEAARVNATDLGALAVLRRATQRAAFAAARAWRRDDQSSEALARAGSAPSSLTPDLELYVDLARSAAALRDVQASLAPFAAPANDGARADAVRLYERLKKRRARARARLRTAFETAA